MKLKQLKNNNYIKMIIVFMCLVTITGCSMEDLGFEYSTGTGLNLTYEKYEKLEYGSSYFETKLVLGGSCENYYSDDEEDWYTCIDDSDSSIRIVLKFKDNKLEHKSSSGLK